MVYVLLILGFVCLIRGADFFVDGCSDLARKFHVSSMVIGLTVVAMGTSLPELAISVSAAARGVDGMAISNVTGSNIFNLLMVCGCCAVIAPLTVRTQTLKRDLPFTIAATLLVLGAGILGLGFGRPDGILLLAIFIIFMVLTVRSAKKSAENGPQEEEFTGFSWVRCLLCLAGGAVAIAAGGQLVVNNAEVIAANFGLSETLIGLTVCAIGTSLPELVTSMTAVRKGQHDMAVGNVIGSCLFNILMILGLTAAVRPVAVEFENIIDMLLLIAVSLIVLLMALPKKQIGRKSGAVCIALYALYMVYICIR